MGSAEYGVEGRASIPHSALRTPHLEQCSLILIGSRDFVTVPAPRLVRLAAPDHDGGAFPDRRPSVVCAHRVEPGVAGIEMRLEDLDVLTGDHRPPDAAHQLLALPGKHHAGNDFDPTWAGTVEQA